MLKVLVPTNTSLAIVSVYRSLDTPDYVPTGDRPIMMAGLVLNLLSAGSL